MGVLRLYRKFYRRNTIRTGSTITEIYTLITPTKISAETFVAGSADTQSTTSIESGIPTVEESPGVFYADLNPTLYSSDVTYDLVWTVQYISIAPLKELSTRFRIRPFNIGNQLDYEILSVYPLEIDVL